MADSPDSDAHTNTRAKRFQAEYELAVATLAGWISHPAVPEIIRGRRLATETLIMPIARYLVDRVEIVRFCWNVFEIAGAGTDWSVQRGEPWMLTVAEALVIERVRNDVRGLAELVAEQLAAAGVPLVPSWTGDRVVVAELLLLEAAEQTTRMPIPWSWPPADLADALQPPPNGAIHIDASGTTLRRGARERAERNLTALRRDYEEHLHGRHPAVRPARTATRASPEPTRRRRAAVAKVLERFPNATASTITTTFGDRTVQRPGMMNTPGGYLRQLLEEAEPGTSPRCPAKSTLHADLKALRAAADRPGRNRPREARAHAEPNARPANLDHMAAGAPPEPGQTDLCASSRTRRSAAAPRLGRRFTLRSGKRGIRIMSAPDGDMSTVSEPTREPNGKGPWWVAAAGGGGGITAAVLQYHPQVWALLAAFIAWLAHNIAMSITDRHDRRA